MSNVEDSENEISPEEVLQRSVQAIGIYLGRNDQRWVEGFILATYLYNRNHANILMACIQKLARANPDIKNLEEKYVSYYQQIVAQYEEL